MDRLHRALGARITVSAGDPMRRADCSSAFMLGRSLSIGVLFVALALFPRNVHADRVETVFVSIVGNGAIRFRLAEGLTVPCDSSRNRVTFDGWLTPGHYAFPTLSKTVCYEHTYGAFREVNWSQGRVLRTGAGYRYQRPLPEVVIETD